MLFKTSQWKLLLIVASCAMVAITSAGMTDQDNRLGFVAVFFGALALVGIWVAFTMPATVMLDDEALQFRQGRTEWRLRWEEIADVGMVATRTYGITTHQRIVITDRRVVRRAISSGLTISQTRLAASIQQYRSGALRPIGHS